MASSKLMSTSHNSGLNRQLSAPPKADFLKLGSSRDEFSYMESNSGSIDGGIEVEPPPRVVKKKTVDDVWRDIVEGKKIEKQPKTEMMTLEDFLVKAGAVDDCESEEKIDFVTVKQENLTVDGGRVYSYDGNSNLGTSSVEFDSKMRGKRSLSLLEPLDKATLQRQRRMIKNRESAARSRERKQAYQVELEAMAMRLEEENERLLREKAERTKKRLKQLIENVIPVVEKRRPPPPQRLRRLKSI